MRETQGSGMSGAGTLHEQVCRELRKRIGNGTYRGKIPTEADMARDLGVSHWTMRRATQVLKDEGILVAKRGYGTFIDWRMLEAQERMNT